MKKKEQKIKGENTAGTENGELTQDRSKEYLTGLTREGRRLWY